MTTTWLYQPHSHIWYTIYVIYISCSPSSCQILFLKEQKPNVWHSLIWQQIYCVLNLILLPGGGHRSSQGNEGIFVQNTFSQLFSISAFALYVGMLSLALPSTATLSLAAFYKSINKWRNPTSPQETKTKWTDFFKIQFKSSLFSSSHMLSVKTFVSIFDILAFISICLRHQIFAVQDFWSQNF